MTDSLLLQHVNNNIADLDTFQFTEEEEIEIDNFVYEVLKADTAAKHANTGRGGLAARRLGRLTIASVFGPIGGLFFILSEAGVIPTSEKHAFIRFQGQVTTHIKRIDKKLGGTKANSLVENIRQRFIKGSKALGDKPEPSRIAKGYADMIASEYALVVAGYLAIMQKSGAEPAAIKEIQNNITDIAASNVKGSGIWNRVKSSIGSFGVGGFRPAKAITKQFVILSNKNPKLGLVKLAQSKLKSIKL